MGPTLAGPTPGTDGQSLQIGKASCNEGTSIGEADVREVQGDPPSRRGLGDLSEPAAQAAAGLGRKEKGSMARIAGVNIPLNKRVEVGLTTIFGIGRSTSQKILE